MIPYDPGQIGCLIELLLARRRRTGSEGTNAFAEADGYALRGLGARRVRLRGGRAEFGAERAPSARRSSRHQRNALTGLPDSEPQLGARGRASRWC
jgi:hypothetical protein